MLNDEPATSGNHGKQFPFRLPSQLWLAHPVTFGQGIGQELHAFMSILPQKKQEWTLKMGSEDDVLGGYNH